VPSGRLAASERTATVSIDPPLSSRTIADAMAEAAHSIDAAQSLDDLLDLIVRTAIDTIPDIDDASITVNRRKGDPSTAAGTPLAYEADDIQYELNEGPCLDVLRTEKFIQADHVAANPRWPNYGPRAAKAGVRSQMGFPLYTEYGAQGALNLYSTQTETLDDEARNIAQLFATYAGMAFGKTRQAEQLNKALSTRKMIGQAIGIVQERYELNEDRAFQFLARVSQTSNIKLADVAAELVSQANARRAAQD